MPYLIRYFLRRERNLTIRYGAGTWAVIMQSTSNKLHINYSEEIARRGFNIILIGQSLSEMEKETSKIIEQFKVKVEIVEFHPKMNIENLYSQMKNNFNGKDISVLVLTETLKINEDVVDMIPQQITDVVNTNCLSRCALIKYFIPRFLERSKKSAIISVNPLDDLIDNSIVELSFASMVNFLIIQMFNDYFIQILNKKYGDKIDFLSYIPLRIKNNNTSRMAKVDINTSVKTSFDHLCYESRTYGHWRHHFYVWLYPSLFFRNI